MVNFLYFGPFKEQIPLSTYTLIRYWAQCVEKDLHVHVVYLSNGDIKQTIHLSTDEFKSFDSWRSAPHDSVTRSAISRLVGYSHSISFPDL